MLDVSFDRPAATPRDAATVLVLRNVPGGIEIFCVKRHVKSGFLGGAVVFPGGKVDESDRDAAWKALTTPAPRFGEEDADKARAFGIAACREALEEAALLLTRGPALAQADIVALRGALARHEVSLRDALADRGLSLDLGTLRPFARWVTPVAESRRFDTRFFLAVAPSGQVGAHDDHETTASFWASPADVLSRFDRGEVELAPPTHRSLEILTNARSSDDAVRAAAACSLDPICPKLVHVVEPGLTTVGLVLPGDPEHEVPEERVAGHSRFVLREGKWRPEPAPRP
jgi:8-oxo-dGTP pyrophosphatase MutT (NUDIX family)